MIAFLFDCLFWYIAHFWGFSIFLPSIHFHLFGLAGCNNWYGQEVSDFFLRSCIYSGDIKRLVTILCLSVWYVHILFGFSISSLLPTLMLLPSLYCSIWIYFFSLVVLLKTLFLLKLSFALKLVFQSCDIVLKFPVNILSEGKLPCSLTRDCGVKDSGVGGCFFFWTPFCTSN